MRTPYHYCELTRLGTLLWSGAVALAILSGSVRAAVDLENWPSAPWNAASGATSIEGEVTDPAGGPAVFQVANPVVNVDLSDPAAPNFSGATISFFGVESSGLGVANVGQADFSRGESFTLQADRPFTLRQIEWLGHSGDEVVHFQWTSGGQSRQMVCAIGSNPFAPGAIVADAGTPVVITNVSPASAAGAGSLGIGSINVALAAPLRVAATGGRMGRYALPAGETRTSFRHRTPHKLGGPLSEIVLGFMNWTHTSTAENPIDNATTLTHVWLERASTGQVAPVTFSGTRQLVMTGSSTVPFYLSDAVASTVWTGSAPARDEVFWVHIKGAVPAGGSIPTGVLASFPGAKFYNYAPAVPDPAPADVAGPAPVVAGANTEVRGLPLLFLGRYVGSGHLAVIGIGDSIMEGSGDVLSPAPVISGNGFLDRAAVDASGANAIAIFNMARHGESANTWRAKHERQEPILQFANVVVEEFGGNDIGISGAGTPAPNVMSAIRYVWGAARAAGVEKIVRTQLLPRTDSASNNWISLADQTPYPAWGEGGPADQVNDSLALAASSGEIDTLVLNRVTVSDPTDDHCWLSDGTNDFMTADGSHPTKRAADRMDEPLREALLALSVDGSGGSTPGALPAPWTGQDIGDVGAAGHATHASGLFTLEGSGADIANTSDEFFYVHQPATGDCQITARVLSIADTHVKAKAGVMIRETLAADAKFAQIVVTPTQLWSESRNATGAVVASSGGGTSEPKPFWVRLKRTGNSFIFYKSTDGVTWTQTASRTMTLSANCFIGLVQCSHADGTLGTSAFDNITVAP